MKIKSTKNYASVVWIFGNFLFSSGDISNATKYLEEGYNCFLALGDRSKAFYQCCSGLGKAYLEQFKITGNKTYYQKAKKLSDLLYEERSSYMSDQTIKNHATQLRREVLSIRV